MHELGGERNAQRVLKQMERYLNVIRDGEHIYYLNAEGRRVVGCNKIRKKTGNVMHYVMRNYIYIAYGMPESWRNEVKIKSADPAQNHVITVIADALFMQDDRYHIVEVDHTQKMSKNRAKMERYRRLIERGAFGRNAPKFVWITTSDHRKREIEKLCDGLLYDVWTLWQFTGI